VADEDEDDMVLCASEGDDSDEVVGKKVVAPGKKEKKEKGSLRKEVRSALRDGTTPEITVKDKRKAENDL
jgi:hypothetical protein